MNLPNWRRQPPNGSFEIFIWTSKSPSFDLVNCNGYPRLVGLESAPCFTGGSLVEMLHSVYKDFHFPAFQF